MADENISDQRRLMQKPDVNASGTSTAYVPEVKEQTAFDKMVLSDGLAVTLERLADLIFAEEEEGFPPPTRYAYLTAFHLLNEAYRSLPASFPRATVSAEENGGVFIYWIKPTCTVQLTVPFEPGKLLYLRTMQNNSPSQVCQNPDGKELARSLVLFNHLT